MVFRDRTYRVLIVSASEKFNTTTKDLLPTGEFWPIKTAGTVGEARRICIEQSFDLILINAPLPDEFGGSFACGMCDSSNSSVIHHLIARFAPSLRPCGMQRRFCLAAQPRLLGAGSVGRTTPLFRVSSCSQCRDLPCVQTHREGPSPPSWSEARLCVPTVCQHLLLLYGKGVTPAMSGTGRRAGLSSGSPRAPGCAWRAVS